MKFPSSSWPLYLGALVCIVALAAGVTGTAALSMAAAALSLLLFILLLILRFTDNRLRSEERRSREALEGELEQHRRVVADLLPLLRLLEAEDRTILLLSGQGAAAGRQAAADDADPLTAARARIAAFSADRSEALRRALSLQTLEPLPAALLEVQARIPYIKLLMERVVSYTEQSALTLLERFGAISEQADAGARDAREAMAGLTDHPGNTEQLGLEALIRRSHESILNRGQVIQEFLAINHENTGRIRKIAELVAKTESLIIGIEDIAERSKIITFNLAVESAKIGIRGQGFKVIVTELQKLNGQTTDFAESILQIVKEFKTYNAELLDRWILKSENLTEKVRADTEQAEITVEALKASYELTRRLFASLSENAIRVNDSMGDILSSLQFQDITRQQIEGACAFISDMETAVDKALTDLPKGGYAVAARTPDPVRLKEIYAPRLKVTSDHAIFDIVARRSR